MKQIICHWVLIFLCMSLSSKAVAQVKVLSIDDGRGLSFDRGYNLFGGQMVNCALPKLLNPELFGPNGIVNQTITADHGFSSYDSITDSLAIQGYDVIFIGFLGVGLQAFSQNEINLLKAWSQQPGKVLVIMEQAAGFPVTNALGYNIIDGFANPTVEALGDVGFTDIFSGPFGAVKSISQQGTSQGSFDLPCGAVVLGVNAQNLPAIVFDPFFRDILSGDTDYFDDLNGDMQNDDTVDTDAERAWCNLWAWVIKEVLTKPKPIVLPATSSTLGKAVWSGHDSLPACGHLNNGQVSATGIISGLNLLDWQTSIDNGATWQQLGDTSKTHNFDTVVNNQQFRFIVGTGKTVGTSCTQYFSTPVIIEIDSVAQSSHSVKICEGESYQGHKLSGTYTDTVFLSNKCNINITTLSVQPKSYSTIDAVICDGEKYFNYTKTGLYVDTLISANGCDSIRTINLKVNPWLYTTINAAICTGQNYLGHKLSGTYIDTLTASNSCDSVRTINLTVNELPIPNLGKKNTVCTGDTLVLNPGQFTNYLWQDSTTTPQYNVIKGGTYWVKVTDENGCEASDTIKITQVYCSLIKIPNTFTPNGDGVNDVWNIYALQFYPACTVSIFTRAGLLIFKSTGYTKPWTGIYNGKQLPNGVYYYIIDLKNNTPPLSGYITLIR